MVLGIGVRENTVKGSSESCNFGGIKTEIPM